MLLSDDVFVKRRLIFGGADRQYKSREPNCGILFCASFLIFRWIHGSERVLYPEVSIVEAIVIRISMETPIVYAENCEVSTFIVFRRAEVRVRKWKIARTMVRNICVRLYSCNHRRVSCVYVCKNVKKFEYKPRPRIRESRILWLPVSEVRLVTLEALDAAIHVRLQLCTVSTTSWNSLFSIALYTFCIQSEKAMQQNFSISEIYAELFMRKNS